MLWASKVHNANPQPWDDTLPSRPRFMHHTPWVAINHLYTAKQSCRCHVHQLYSHWQEKGPHDQGPIVHTEYPSCMFALADPLAHKRAQRAHQHNGLPLPADSMRCPVLGKKRMALTPFLCPSQV